MNTQGKSIEEILKIINTLDKIEQVDMTKVEEKLNTPVARVLQKKEVLNRAIRPKKPGRPKLHWKTREKRLRERKARYYQQSVKPRRQKALEEYLRVGDWYSICHTAWMRKKNPQIRLTRTEWEANVAHTIPEGRVPVVVRYDAKKPIQLDNIEVIDNITHEVYFSGLDWALYKAQAQSRQRTGIIE